MNLIFNRVNFNNSKCFSPLPYLVQSQRTIMVLIQALVAQNSVVPKLCKMKPLSCPGKETKQT